VTEFLTFLYVFFYCGIPFSLKHIAFIYAKTNLGRHSWLRHYAKSRKVVGLSPDEVDFFQFTLSFQPHYGSGFNSASKRNDYQESSWGVKGGQRVRLTT
jgi:hypothetical protein